MDNAKYTEAHKKAVDLAKALQRDVGIAYNKIFKTFTVFALPKPENRRGHELTCEVIRPTDPLRA